RTHELSSSPTRRSSDLNKLSLHPAKPNICLKNRIPQHGSLPGFSIQIHQIEVILIRFFGCNSDNSRYGCRNFQTAKRSNNYKHQKENNPDLSVHKKASLISLERFLIYRKLHMY